MDSRRHLALDHVARLNDARLHDERVDLRQRTLFAVGKLTVGEREHVCTVRNISAGGVGVDTDLPLVIGGAVRIEMRGLAPTDAIVRWVQGGQAGLEFLDRIVVDLESGSSQRVLRSPRFAYDRTVTLVVDGVAIPVATRDIALGGMKLGTGAGVPIGTPVTVRIDAAGVALRGRICWQGIDAVGVRFTTPLPAAGLAEILVS